MKIIKTQFPMDLERESNRLNRLRYDWADGPGHWAYNKHTALAVDTKKRVAAVVDWREWRMEVSEIEALVDGEWLRVSAVNEYTKELFLPQFDHWIHGNKVDEYRISEESWVLR